MSEYQNLVGRLKVSGDIGEKLDEGLEKAKEDVLKIKGAQVALKTAADKVLSLHKHADDDFKGGAYDNLEPNDVRALVKKYVTLAHESALNLKEKAASDLLVANGKVVALQEAVALVQRYHTNAHGRIESVLAGLMERKEAEARGEDITIREPRNGRQSLAQRKAEGITPDEEE